MVGAAVTDAARDAYELFSIIMFDRSWSTYIEKGQG